MGVKILLHTSSTLKVHFLSKNEQLPTSDLVVGVTTESTGDWGSATRESSSRLSCLFRFLHFFRWTLCNSKESKEMYCSFKDVNKIVVEHWKEVFKAETLFIFNQQKFATKQMYSTFSLA